MIKLKFGNCSDCHRYLPIDSEGRCLDCLETEYENLNRALDYLLLHPKATGEEIAKSLEISFSRIEEWIRDGRIRCVLFRSRCPECSTPLENQFTCPHCGTQLVPPPPPKEQRKKQSKYRLAFLEGRYDENSPRNRNRRRSRSL